MPILQRKEDKAKLDKKRFTTKLKIKRTKEKKKNLHPEDVPKTNNRGLPGLYNSKRTHAAIELFPVIWKVGAQYCLSLAWQNDQIEPEGKIKSRSQEKSNECPRDTTSWDFWWVGGYGISGKGPWRGTISLRGCATSISGHYGREEGAAREGSRLRFSRQMVVTFVKFKEKKVVEMKRIMNPAWITCLTLMCTFLIWNWKEQGLGIWWRCELQLLICTILGAMRVRNTSIS